MKAFTIAAIFVLILSSLFVNSQNLSGTNIDDFINAIIKQDKIPGLSIAVVSHDSVIYAKGFGIKKTGGSDRIDEHTLFEAVSLTKSFTALLLGMLVDQEKIKWTDPVVKYIPDFETNEDFVTQKLTIQDLLTLRSGLLDGDKLSGSTRMELVPQIKNLKISDSFRLSQTSYNLNYALAGLIVEILSGESWENMMKERIFSTLKMSETYTDIPTALSFNNFSTPHFVKDGNIVPTQWRDYSIYSPAEGIYSNVFDLAKWIKLQLNNGTFDNHSIITTGALADMQKPQNIAMDLFKEYFNPEANFMTMGIGWFISDYKGLKIIQMGGLSSGTTNLITIIPSKKIGIIIQANKGLVFDSFVKINYKIINNLIYKIN